MKDYYINQLLTGDEFTDFFICKGATIRTGANGKDYFDISLGDKTGELNGKKWDISEEEHFFLSQIQDGEIVKVKGQVSEWNGIKQLRIQKLRTAVDNDALDMTDFIKAAPEDPEKMYSFLWDGAEKIQNNALKALVKNTLDEVKERLLYYPGASKNHHAEYAGLLYHTKRMLDMGEKAVTVYTNLDPDWVIAGVIMHDMEKLNEIVADKTGIASGYSLKGKLLGHLVMGAIEMEERGKKAGLTDEQIILMQHMMISHHYEPDFGSPVRPMFPEAELLHYLDMIDAKMFDFEAALEGVDPGQFSERIRTLDNRMVYKKEK